MAAPRSCASLASLTVRMRYERIMPMIRSLALAHADTLDPLATGSPRRAEPHATGASRRNRTRRRWQLLPRGQRELPGGLAAPPVVVEVAVVLAVEEVGGPGLVDPGQAVEDVQAGPAAADRPLLVLADPAGGHVRVTARLRRVPDIGHGLLAHAVGPPVGPERAGPVPAAEGGRDLVDRPTLAAPRGAQHLPLPSLGNLCRHRAPQSHLELPAFTWLPTVASWTRARQFNGAGQRFPRVG